MNNKDIWSDAVDAVGNAISSINVESLLTGVLSNVALGLLGGLFGKRNLQTIDFTNKGWFDDAINSIVNVGTQVGNAIGDFVSNPTVQSIATGVATNVLIGLIGKRDVSGEVDKNILDFFGNIIETIQSAVVQGINVVLAAGLNLFGKRNLSGEVDKNIVEFFENIFETIQSAVVQGINVVLAAGLNLFGKRSVIDDILATLGQHASNIGQQLSQVGGALLEALQPTLADLQDQLTNHALNAAQSLVGALAGISGTLQG